MKPVMFDMDMVQSRWAGRRDEQVFKADVQLKKGMLLIQPNEQSQ